MDPQTQEVLIIAAAVVAGLLVIGVIGLAARRSRERRILRERYGPEYDRTVAAYGSQRAAVRDLRERQYLRVETRLSDLNDTDRDMVRRHMAWLQYRFVEDPSGVMLSAGRVVAEVLKAKGYPIAEDRERALRVFSVDHPVAAVDVRALLEGRYSDDMNRMRDVFLGVRDALASVAGIFYGAVDAAPEVLARKLTTGQIPTVEPAEASTTITLPDDQA